MLCLVAYRQNALNVVDSNKILLYFLVLLFYNMGPQCSCNVHGGMFITRTTCQIHSKAHFIQWHNFSVSRGKLWRRTYLRLYLWLSYTAGMRFPSDQNFRNFQDGCIWHGNLLWKYPENPRIDEFPECEPFNQKSRKFR